MDKTITKDALCNLIIGGGLGAAISLCLRFYAKNIAPMYLQEALVGTSAAGNENNLIRILTIVSPMAFGNSDAAIANNGVAKLLYQYGYVTMVVFLVFLICSLYQLIREKDVVGIVVFGMYLYVLMLGNVEVQMRDPLCVVTYLCCGKYILTRHVNKMEMT